ncbi:MAG: hypothetical protein NT077_00335 [Candidatus Taylorbacteria bacterium]|nr:hypothetical protein [Candidatus Taylorbacteria bacterium]
MSTKYTPVTVGQMECGRKMANEKKVGRAPFQLALDDGRFARFLDSIKVDHLCTYFAAITPPPGARIHMVRVRVKQDREWQEAVNAAGPNTPDHYNVRKVADLYTPIGTGEAEENLVLLNYQSGGGSWGRALAWAESLGLKNTNPREVFAVGEKYPILHKTLALNPMYVVATTECSFVSSCQACCVWWDGARRDACLRWIGDFIVSADVWFAFRK